MKSILREIAKSTAERYEQRKRDMPLCEVKRKIADGAGSLLGPFAFENALREAGFALICEIKKASPSKGVISENFPYMQKAKDYVWGGAAAISCLTEPKYFLGSDAIFSEVRGKVNIPMLRKDFTLDEYQIYESRALGADAVLLISPLLSESQMSDFLALAKELGMNALCECRTEDEIERAVETGAKVIGVNNRDLSDFSVDVSRAERFLGLVPPDRVLITESGIRDAGDVRRAYRQGFGGVLMGEAPMRSDDAYRFLLEVKECLR
ncbi:MAG: indole-3-glycerol phosphate synthase TrpC [Clostridia bacterium]|nr:indole-3-glycerol phosphate synthase TrpC [Clostridia bacterium]